MDNNNNSNNADIHDDNHKHPGIRFVDVVTQSSQWDQLSLLLLTASAPQNWRALGSQLGKTDMELNYIEITEEPKNLVKALLKEWQNRQSGDVDVLFHALKVIDNHTVYLLVHSWLKCDRTPKKNDRQQLQIIHRTDLVIDTQPCASGSFAHVYKATWHGIPVAVKRLLRFRTKDADQEFLKEASLLSKCQFPNIVRFYGVTETDYEIVMELATRGSLCQVLHNPSEDLPWNLRLEITAGIARGLNYLHSNDIIHRDIKSQNILLDESYQPKLTDFGLAKTLSTSNPQQPSMIGTSRWIAPEVLLGGHHTFASDVYSLGMVFWEIASRKQPYAETNDHMATYLIIEGKKETVPDSCPTGLQKVILGCWLEPTERPTSRKLTEWLSSKEYMEWREIENQKDVAELASFVQQKRAPVSVNSTNTIPNPQSPSMINLTSVNMLWVAVTGIMVAFIIFFITQYDRHDNEAENIKNMKLDCYNTLNVGYSATQEQIKDSFRKLIRK